MDWFDALEVQGILKSLLQHNNLKAPILWRPAFFMVQLSHPYIATGKTTALTIQTLALVIGPQKNKWAIKFKVGLSFFSIFLVSGVSEALGFHFTWTPLCLGYKSLCTIILEYTLVLDSRSALSAALPCAIPLTFPAHPTPHPHDLVLGCSQSITWLEHT